jgi:hypothetical protein
VWWAELLAYLRELQEGPLEWHFEPVQEIFACRATLSLEARERLGRFLRTAPEEAVAQNRTLRRAVELPAHDAARLGVVFLSEEGDADLG